MQSLEIVGLEIGYNPRGEKQAADGLRRLQALADETQKVWEKIASGTGGVKPNTSISKQILADQAKADRQYAADKERLHRQSLAEQSRSDRQASQTILALKKQEFAELAKMERARFSESQRLERLRISEAGKNARVSQLPSASPSSLLNNALGIGVGVGAVALGTAAAKSAIDLENLTIGLRTTTGSAAETEAQLKRLEEIARAPGLAFPQAALMSINLQSAGVNARLAERSISAFGNALVSVGKGKNELDGVGLALTQIASQTRVSQEEINQLRERVPQVKKAIEAAFGTSNTDALAKLGIDGQRFIEGLVTQLEKLPKANGASQTSFENLGDSASRSLAKIGKPILEIVVPALDLLAPKIEAAGKGFSSLDDDTQKLLLSMGLVAVSVGPASRAVVGLSGAIATTTTAISGAGGIVAAMGTLNPVTLALGGAAIAGTAIWYEYARGIDAARASIDEAYKRASGTRELLNGEKSRLETLPDGTKVNLLPGTESKIDLTGFPKINIAGYGNPATKPTPTTPKPPTTPTRARAGKAASPAKEFTEAERLKKQIEDLNKESALLRNEISPEYALRVKLYNAQETRNELEELFRLRRQFGFDGNLEQLRGLAEYDRVSKSNANVALAVEPNQFVLKLLEDQKRVADEAAGAIERRNNALNLRVDVAESSLELDKEVIQTRLLAGTISEAQARKEILATERLHKTELLDALETKKHMSGLDAAAIKNLDIQIERVKQLGVQLTLQQRIKASLAAPDTFEDTLVNATSGLRGDVKNAFAVGIREGWREGSATLFDELANRLIDISSDAFTRILFDGVGGKLGGFKTPGINPNANTPNGKNPLGKIGELFGIGGKKTTGAASDTLATTNQTLASMLSESQSQTRLLEDIAASSRNSVSCCEQGQANAARSQNVSGLSKALGIASSIAGIAGSIFGAASGLAGKSPLPSSGDPRITFGSGGFDGDFNSGLNSYLSNRFLPSRANGGEVFAGTFYNTHGLSTGREVFMPATNGTIFNQKQLAAIEKQANQSNVTSNNHFNITVQMTGSGQSALDARRTGDQISARVAEKLERTRRNQ